MELEECSAAGQAVEYRHLSTRVPMPFRRLISEHDVITPVGAVMRIWRLDARLAHPSKGCEADGSCCTLLKRRADRRFRLSSYRVCGNLNPYQGFPDGGAAALYLAVEHRVSCGFELAAPNSPAARSTALAAQVRAVAIMQQIGDVVEQVFAKFTPHLLGDYFIDGSHYNEVVDFLHALVRGSRHG